MKILGVIPARFASTRFPGKPLADICGKSMIQRVYERAVQAKTLTQVVVATDDERIYEHVKEFGGQVAMTSQLHESGTDRCAEVALQFPEYEGLINIQGDEPLIDPRQIDLLGSKLQEKGVILATLIKRVNNAEELFNPNIPKVVVKANGEAIYFSRQTIPYLRGSETSEWVKKHTYYRHIGIYGYRADTLQLITKIPLSTLEKTECLEQLRWIENGLAIHTAITDAETLAIDTPEDLEKIVQLISAS
ncbi:MAG: 3-deoxy-manno-octulosonate cytidylyltransferase [Sphingobacteriaceae bacterium]